MTEGQFWPPAQPRVVEGPEGPMGPQGPPGTAYLSSQWTFNQTITPSPANGGLRFNATTAAATTVVWISETDRDGLNRAAGLDQLQVGDQMMIQSQQGRTVFNVVAHADSGTYRSITVTVAETAGTRPSASAITTVYLMTAGAAGVTDHGALTGLADNDHPQYAVVDNAFPTRLWITADATNPSGSVDGDYRIRPA